MSLHIKVHDGTMRGDMKSLCDTCRWAKVTAGYREKDRLVHCGACKANNALVPFPVARCSEYDKKGSMLKSEMENIALIIDPERVHVCGFAPTKD